VPNNFEAFDQRHDGGDALGELEHLVGHNAGDQKVTLAFGVLENIQVSNVKEVKPAGRVADAQPVSPGGKAPGGLVANGLQQARAVRLSFWTNR
jgi:hypothetical protein